jgi:hypothetical protein
VRYKQTVVGDAWAVIRPVLTMVIFTVIFGRIAKLPSDGACLTRCDLFLGSEDVKCVFPAGSTLDFCRPPLATYRHFVRLSGGECKRVEYAAFDGVDRSLAPSRHIIAEMSASAGITCAVAIRPYLTSTDAEKDAAA